MAKESNDEFLAKLMTGMGKILVDFEGMKEKQGQFEEILLGTTLPGKTPAKEEFKSKGKDKSSKEDRSNRKSKSNWDKKGPDSSDSSDSNDSSSSSSSSSSDDGSDPDLDPDDLFAQAFADKPGKADKFKFVNPIRGSSPTKNSKHEKKSRKSLMFSKETYSTANEPHYTRMQPSFDHIKLEKLNAPSVIRFLQQLNEYQQKHRISLKAGTLIDRRIINDLMADNYVHDWDFGDFYELDTVTIVQLLQKAMKPDSKEAFRKQLENYLDFRLPLNYTPHVTNFKPFHRALLTYRTQFKQLYDYMSYDNKRNVPDCHNKPGGLIKIFVSKITPSRYAEKVVQSWKKQSFKHVDEFLDLFYKQVQRSHDVYMKAKDASYLFDEPAPYTASKTNVSMGASNTTSRKPSSGYNDSSKGEGKHTLAGRVNALSAQREDDSDSDSVDTQLMRRALRESMEEARDDRGDSENVSYSKLSAEELDFERQQSSVSAMNNSAFQKPKQQDRDAPNGCFHLLFKGECLREAGKCTYSHDAPVMTATHSHYQKLLDNYKYKPRSQDSSKATYGSVKVLQHANLGAVMDPAMDRLLYDTFLAAFPGGSLVKHVLKKGLIDTLVEAITVPKVLFDTYGSPACIVHR